MYAQPFLPLPRQQAVRLRAIRRPFAPSPAPGPYRLPAAVLDHLTSLLEPFRNRDAAFALAVFLARFWSAPGRLALAFPIDRRALADHADLGLTEARVRGALATLEMIGFLDRAMTPAGSRYKPTPDGLHRKPVLWQFGSEFANAFQSANNHARAARSSRQGDRRSLVPAVPSRPSMPILAASPPRSPKDKLSSERVFLMGDLQRGSPGGSLGLPAMSDPAVSRSPVEEALARFELAFRSRNIEGEQ